MNRKKTLEHVRRIILETRPSLHPSRVTEAASLTRDLDLDVDLGQLDTVLSRSQREVAETDRALTPWYIQALRAGHDTVGSLVDFLLESRSGSPALGLKAA